MCRILGAVLSQLKHKTQSFSGHVHADRAQPGNTYRAGRLLSWWFARPDTSTERPELDMALRRENAVQARVVVVVAKPYR